MFTARKGIKVEDFKITTRNLERIDPRKRWRLCAALRMHKVFFCIGAILIQNEGILKETRKKQQEEIQK